MNYQLIKNNNWKKIEINNEKQKIPQSWTKDNLETLFFITSSRRVHADKYVKEGIPFFRGTEINNFKKGIYDFDIFISKDFFNEIKNKYPLPQKDDILVTAVGTVGNTFLIEKEFDFYFKDGNIIWLKNNNQENKKYIDYFFNTEYAKDKIFGLGDGSAYNALTIKTFSKSEVILPTRKEQDSIVHILSKQENIISNIEKLIKKNEIIFNELSEHLLSGELRLKEDEGKVSIYKNPEDNWKEVEVNGEVKKIPREWDFEKFSQNIKFTMGNTPKKQNDNYNGDLPWITISNFTNKYISEYTANIKKLKNVKILSKGTLLGSFKMSVGKFAFTVEDCTTNEAIIAIKENDTIHNLDFLYYILPNYFIKNAE